MLYSVMVYKVSGSKRKKLYSMEIQARDEINALEKANVRLTSRLAKSILFKKGQR